MRKLVKYIAAKTYRPLLVRYLSKTRRYSYKGISLEVPPGVFHPGFFFSTRFLLKHVEEFKFRNREVLELGCGTGLLGIYAASRGAYVTAIDINPAAITTMKINAAANDVSVRVLQSDMYAALNGERFDIILVNPPYYKKNPSSAPEYAWYCGEQGEYFQSFFNGLSDHLHPNALVLMVLCDGCDLDMITQMATQRGFSMSCVRKKKNLIETNYIFSIRPQA